MHILVTGAGGMIGRRLVARLLADGTLNGTAITGLTLADAMPMPDLQTSLPVTQVTGDLTAPGAVANLFDPVPDMVFHLAAVVSGIAESDFDLGYAVNLGATQALLEAARTTARVPRVVAASSIAVFGAPLPDVIPDDHPTLPRTSYGAQKAMLELLVSDYSRKGMIDGLALRLPTIIVRPGAPNGAASSFYSSILREPLAGERATLPVSRDIRHWFASPDAAVGYLIHAAGVDTAPLGARRAMNLPGLSATVGELIEALTRVAGADTAALIDEIHDPEIAEIVLPWPRNFAPERALSLGFRGDASLDAIIETHIADMRAG